MPPSCHSAATNRDDDQTAFIDRVIGGNASGIDEAIAEFERGTDAGPDGDAGSVDSRPSRFAQPWHSAGMAQPKSPKSALYALDPTLPVLLRPDGAVQVGWSPRRAVLIHPPRGLTPAGLATLLRTMHAPVPMSELQRQAGVAAGELGDLVAKLVAAGVATRGHRQRPVQSASIRVHGRGPLSDLLLEALRCSGARVKQSSQPHAAVSAADADLVVLSDNLIADPRMLRDLHSKRVAHLAVRVRDGTGLIGPLVIPGVTSCLDNH